MQNHNRRVVVTLLVRCPANRRGGYCKAIVTNGGSWVYLNGC